jgi:hypothetical protein
MFGSDLKDIDGKKNVTVEIRIEIAPVCRVHFHTCVVLRLLGLQMARLKFEAA